MAVWEGSVYIKGGITHDAETARHQILGVGSAKINSAREQSISLLSVLIYLFA